MNIRDIGNICIVDMCKDTISQTDVRKLQKILLQKPQIRRLGINMHKISSIDCSFYKFIENWEMQKNTKAAFFNTEVAVLVQFFVSGMDSHVNIYFNKNDFLDDRRLIVRRRFKLLKSA